MSKTKRTYSAAELSAQTHVPLRTIRYYRNQRLLPAPQGKGPAARYTDKHLDVLNAIHDSRNYLPLAQIRRILAELPERSDLVNEPGATIEAFFANIASTSTTDSGTIDEPTFPTGTTSDDSAAGYAARALHSMPGYGPGLPSPNSWSVRPAGQPVGRELINTPLDDIPDVIATTRPSAPGLVLHGYNPPDTNMAAPGLPPVKFAPGSAPLPADSKYQASGRSSWERIPLGPDLEIHVQRPSTRAGNRALERILSSATDILKEEGLL